MTIYATIEMMREWADNQNAPEGVHIQVVDELTLKQRLSNAYNLNIRTKGERNADMIIKAWQTVMDNPVIKGIVYGIAKAGHTLLKMVMGLMGLLLVTNGINAASVAVGVVILSLLAADLVYEANREEIEYLWARQAAMQ